MKLASCFGGFFVCFSKKGYCLSEPLVTSAMLTVSHSADTV